MRVVPGIRLGTILMMCLYHFRIRRLVSHVRSRHNNIVVVAFFKKKNPFSKMFKSRRDLGPLLRGRMLLCDYLGCSLIFSDWLGEIWWFCCARRRWESLVADVQFNLLYIIIFKSLYLE